jgi:hypothetical protein
MPELIAELNAAADALADNPAAELFRWLAEMCEEVPNEE